MRLSARQIAGIVFAAVISVVITRYYDFLPYRWQTFNAPDGSFSAQFPGKPAVADRQVQSTTGAVIVMHEVTVAPSKSTTYSCMHYDDPRLVSETVEEVLNSSRDDGIANVQGHLVSEQRLEFAGHPARDIEARVRGNAILDMRLVAAGQQMFVLMVVDGAHGNPDSKNTRKVF
ncbi:MAG TPA: hypothetical protein VIY69_16670 [Candidatus Acidoferrales bacterium]